MRTEKAAGLQEPGSLPLPFWRREKIRGISVLSAWCYSYFGMHGSSVGSGPFSVHGTFCLSSVRSSDTVQKWQFTIATIAMDGCQTHPAPSFGASTDSQHRCDSHMEEKINYIGAYVNNVFLFISYFTPLHLPSLFF